MWGSGDTAVTLVRHESVMAEVAGGAPTLATNAPDTAAAWHAVTVPRRVAPSAATNAMGVCLVCEKGEEGHKCSDLEGSSMSRMLPVPPHSPDDGDRGGRIVRIHRREVAPDDVVCFPVELQRLRVEIASGQLFHIGPRRGAHHTV
jgi:hypothetical protein